MRLPLPRGTITASFYQPRPFKDPTHIHGALDISYGTGPFPDHRAVAPCTGTLVAYQFLRAPGSTWDPAEKASILHQPPRHYFYDTYGGLITIEEPNGRYHILTHFWAAALHDRFKMRYVESSYVPKTLSPSFPCVAFISDPVKIREGDPLVLIGSAGYSTGSHIHWEIHPTRKLVPYADRIDPASLLEPRP